MRIIKQIENKNQKNTVNNDDCKQQQKTNTKSEKVTLFYLTISSTTQNTAEQNKTKPKQNKIKQNKTKNKILNTIVFMVNLFHKFQQFVHQQFLLHHHIVLDQ